MRLAFLLSVFPAALSFVQPAAAETTFYVSPRGNDAWSGRLAEPK